MTQSSPSLPTPKKAVETLVSYRPALGKASTAKPIRLSANEGALGWSDKVEQVLREEAFQINHYNLPQSADLHQAIADRYGLQADRILTSNGSDELIGLICLAYLEDGDEVIHTQYGFLVFPQATRIAGGVPVVAADDADLTVSVDNILAAVSARTKIVFLANPNNPTGTMISEDEVRRLHAGLPPHVILVLDWAYAEYVADGMSYGARMVEEADNVVMFRTFSKMHGLAAQRLGWGYFPDAIRDVLASIRPPFSINSVASALGIAAVKDTEFQEKSLTHNAKWQTLFPARMAQIGFTVRATTANFFLIEFGNAQAGYNGPSAEQALAFMAERNILLREMTPYQLDGYLRMSIGTDAEMEVVLEAFAALMKADVTL